MTGFDHNDTLEMYQNNSDDMFISVEYLMTNVSARPIKILIQKFVQSKREGQL